MIRQIVTCVAIAGLPFFVNAQDAATLMQEGQKLEMQLKTEDALAKYQSAFQLQPTNMNAAVKSAELNCAMGAKQTTEQAKIDYFQKAKNYSDQALKLDSQSADANYITAVVYGKLTEIEKSNDKIVEAVKNIKLYADKALAINPNYGKAWNVLGKWHYEMLNLNMFKKAAIKVMYNGIAKSTIEECIADLEKCKSLEPYYCRNYLDLAKAYNYNKQYEKALATLQQCIKCPTRQPDDAELKAEAKDLLVKWQ